MYAACGGVEVAPLDGVVGLLVQRRQRRLGASSSPPCGRPSVTSTRPVTPCWTASPRNSSRIGRTASAGWTPANIGTGWPWTSPIVTGTLWTWKARSRVGFCSTSTLTTWRRPVVGPGQADDGVEVVAGLGHLRRPQDEQQRDADRGVRDLLEVGVRALDDHARATGHTAAAPRHGPRARHRAGPGCGPGRSAWVGVLRPSGR